MGDSKSESVPVSVLSEDLQAFSFSFKSVYPLGGDKGMKPADGELTYSPTSNAGSMHTFIRLGALNSSPVGTQACSVPGMHGMSRGFSLLSLSSSFCSRLFFLEDIRNSASDQMQATPRIDARILVSRFRAHAVKK